MVTGDVEIASLIGRSRENRKTVKFGDVVREVKEIVDRSTTDLDRYVAGGHMDSDDFHLRRWGTITEDYLGPAFHRLFKKGQILYGSRRTYLKKVSIAPFDGICANTTFVLESADSDTLLPELIPHIMLSESFTSHAISKSRGSTNPYVVWNDIAAFEFPLPPKEEQRRIAEVLQACEESLESYDHSTKNASSLLTAIRRQLFEEDACTHDSISLEQAGKWLSGGTPKRSNPDFWGGDFPWVSPKDMKCTLIQDSEEHITSLALKRRATVVNEGTLLMVIRGMILAHTFPVAIAGREVAFNQDMKALVVSEHFHQQYVFHWLKHNSMKLLKLVAESSHGTKRLPMQSVFELQIPKPPLERQNSVVETLEQCVSEIDGLEHHVQLTLRLKKHLLNHLLGQ
ncbi:MAG: restriction endonuclease subunit S [Planctomycetaceae bacterium]